MNATTMAAPSERRTLLHRVLLTDGALCGVMGVLLVAAAGPLGDLLGLPALLLRLVGVVLLPWAAFVLVVGSRPVVPRRAAWSVFALNLAWMAASVVLLASGWVDPTGLGMAFVIAQAIIVAGIADVQFIALRRAT